MEGVKLFSTPLYARKSYHRTAGLQCNLTLKKVVEILYHGRLNETYSLRNAFINECHEVNLKF